VCVLCTDLCAMQAAKTERRAAADRKQEVEWLKYELKSSRYIYNCLMLCITQHITKQQSSAVHASQCTSEVHACWYCTMLCFIKLSVLAKLQAKPARSYAVATLGCNCVTVLLL
jgi:hypothetical protein